MLLVFKTHLHVKLSPMKVISLHLLRINLQTLGSLRWHSELLNAGGFISLSLIAMDSLKKRNEYPMSIPC